MAAPIGLDIGSSAVRAAQVRVGRGASALERFGQVPLPPGAVRGGEIVDTGIVADALRRLWKQARFKGRKVAIGLANQQVVVRRLDLPFMTEDELRTSLPLQIDGQIPIPVDEAVLDFQILSQVPAAEGVPPSTRVLLVVAYRDLIAAYVEACRLAGGRLVAAAQRRHGHAPAQQRIVDRPQDDVVADGRERQRRDQRHQAQRDRDGHELQGRRRGGRGV